MYKNLLFAADIEVDSDEYSLLSNTESLRIMYNVILNRY